MYDLAIAVPGGQINVWHRPGEEDEPTTVLVHGLSGNSRWWTTVIDHLPAGIGIIALDVRGRGLSVDAPPPFDLTTVADDIVRTLDHFGVDRAIVAGYSMGGWIAAVFGVDHASRVDRLVLVDGGLHIPGQETRTAEDIIDDMVGPSLRRFEIEFDDPEAFFEYWRGHPALSAYWDESMRPALGHELIEQGGRYEVRANPEAIRVGAEEITLPGRANDAAPKLEVPTHLIVVERGTLDQPGGMIPLSVAEKAAAEVESLTIEYLEGLNHYTLVLGAGAPAVASAIASTR